jgi:hypothetical protein
VALALDRLDPALALVGLRAGERGHNSATVETSK